MAENAKTDANFVATVQGVSSVDGETPVDIYVNPVNGALLLES